VTQSDIILQIRKVFVRKVLLPWPPFITTMNTYKNILHLNAREHEQV
jgi:hypothetical protein